MRTLILALMLGCCIPATTGASEPRTFSSDELKALSGRYDLADGRELYVIKHGRKLYAQLDGQPPIELAHAGGSTFHGPGGMRLAFRQYPNGVVTGVELETRTGAQPMVTAKK